jgi:hypothetical protein
VAATYVVLADSNLLILLAVYAAVVAIPLAFSDRVAFGIACFLVTLVSVLALCIGFLLPGAVLLLLLAQIRLPNDWTPRFRAIYFAVMTLVCVLGVWSVQW